MGKTKSSNKKAGNKEQVKLIGRARGNKVKEKWKQTKTAVYKELKSR